MSDDAGSREAEAARKAARRRRVEQLGELLPDTTTDERADWGERPSGSRDDSRDDEFLRDVPPHHG
jgi:hypothetical protein